MIANSRYIFVVSSLSNKRLKSQSKAALIHFYSSARGISRTELYRRGKIIRLRYIFKSGRRVNVLLKVHHCWIVNSLYRLVVMNCLILHAATTVARSGHRQKPSIIQTKSNLLLYSTASFQKKPKKICGGFHA